MMNTVRGAFSGEWQNIVSIVIFLAERHNYVHNSSKCYQNILLTNQ